MSMGSGPLSWGAIPDILPELALVLAFALACGPCLRARPLPFYVAFWVAGAATLLSDRIPAFAQSMVQLIAGSYAGVAFYLLVMFAGALPSHWRVTKSLLSVRSELSIIGGIVVLFHTIRVVFLVPLSFSAYWGMIWGPAALAMLVACGIIGPALVACFLVPWVASFRFVRRRMSHRTWKRVQLLAYPFMALMLLQGLFLGLGHAIYLGPSGPGFLKYALTAALYGALLVAYAWLRVAKARRRRARRA